MEKSTRNEQDRTGGGTPRGAVPYDDSDGTGSQEGAPACPSNILTYDEDKAQPSLEMWSVMLQQSLLRSNGGW